jgi:hypothetical protein
MPGQGEVSMLEKTWHLVVILVCSIAMQEQVAQGIGGGSGCAGTSRVRPTESPATPQDSPEVASPGQTTGPSPIVAVFDVQDASEKFNTKTLDQLTDYLSAKLTEVAGYKVIPRDQIRVRLKGEQSESYKQCYDQSCQIELGRSLAAQKTLSTKLLQVGRKCAISSVLYDLKTETAEKAASVDTDCSDDALMGGMAETASKLAGRMTRQAEPDTQEPKLPKKPLAF